MAVNAESATGQIVQDGIRYLLMRPDVLMGVGRYLSGLPAQAFLLALEESAFKHVQGSLALYQSQEPLAGAALMASLCEKAAGLGWGVWRTTEHRRDSFMVEVQNSPFAAGFGSSEVPVCAAITGILRAASITGYGETKSVVELTCAAQGGALCRFEVHIRGN